MPKKILVWFWSGGGGGSQFAVDLACRLGAEFGREAIKLSLRADDPTLANARDRGVVTLPADVVSDRRRPLDSVARLATSSKTLISHAADVEVVIVAMNFAIAAPISLLLKKPLIYCAHDPTPHPGDYEQIGQQVTQSILLRRASTVVALSHCARIRLESGIARGKVRVAALSSVFAPRPSESRPGSPVHFLFAGRMIAYKGLEVLVEAFELLSHRTDWRLTIAGRGPALTRSLRVRLTRPQVALRVDDWLRDSEFDALYQNCDVVIAPYLAASQSGVVAQALANGKPCIVTPVGALPEQIAGGVAGWVTSSKSASALADAVERVLDATDEVREKTAGAKRTARTYWEGDDWAWLGRWLD